MKRNPEAICETCPFWEARPKIEEFGDDFGVCRRHAPTPHQWGQDFTVQYEVGEAISRFVCDGDEALAAHHWGMMAGVFPLSPKYDTCGEHPDFVLKEPTDGA